MSIHVIQTDKESEHPMYINENSITVMSLTCNNQTDKENELRR